MLSSLARKIKRVSRSLDVQDAGNGVIVTPAFQRPVWLEDFATFEELRGEGRIALPDDDCPEFGPMD